MTGFAQARVERDGGALRINLRSVNHRFLDLHLRMPDGFEVFESRIRQAVRDRVRRGHVDVNVYYETAGASGIEVNREVAAAYMKAVEQLRREFDVRTRAGHRGSVPVAGRGGRPGLGRRISKRGRYRKNSARRLTECLEQALKRMETMRRAEGDSLTKEMNGMIGANFIAGGRDRNPPGGARAPLMRGASRTGCRIC